MKIEKKLIVCSIAALLIGVSAVFPLAFLMSATAQPSNGPEPWFSIDMPYAYWETLNGPILHPEMTNFTAGLNETNSVSEQHIIALNLTLTADTTKQEADAQLEYYQIEIISDKELIKKEHWMVGTNIESSFNVSSLLKDFRFMRDEWFDTNSFDLTYGGGGGLVRNEWSTGVSILWPKGGSGTGSIGASGTYREVDALREAETVTISIYRVGFVTFSGESTIVTLTNNELVDQIQLEKYGEEGWLYNNLVPDEYLVTVDLMRPVAFEDLLP
ncbi:MAG: hypothetical protein NUK63_01945 [Candidatus Bathyarchaeum tardum]|nr:MAG: hypothetical protein NUK63_01945 [Candidatus Bathyarchaeum tardum]